MKITESERANKIHLKPQLSPGEKLEQALILYQNARELKTAAIKKFYPNLNEKEVNQKVKEIFLYAKS
jgi:hypothetical protein